MTGMITLEYLGCAIAVSGGAEDLAWLREFLSPPFTVTERDASHRVSFTTDPKRYAAVFMRGPARDGGKIPCFAFDQREVEYPRWQGADGEAVVFDAEFRTFYVVNDASATIEVVAPDDNHWPRVGLMRVVREIAVAHAEANGALSVHGAAVALGGHAAVLAGPKRSGKTSLLFHTLLHDGAALVANDRLMLHRQGAAWQATGMPTVISVRKGTRALFPDAFEAAVEDTTPASLSRRERATYAEKRAGREDGSLVLNPDQLCDLSGVERIGSTALGAIVLPRVDPAQQGLTVIRLSAADAVAGLPGALFRPASRFFYTLGRETGFPAIDGRGVIDAVSGVVPCFACVLGENAYSAATRAEILSQLLGSP
jgi:hypothetical protein